LDLMTCHECCCARGTMLPWPLLPVPLASWI
jgi:hypothetical protein